MMMNSVFTFIHHSLYCMVAVILLQGCNPILTTYWFAYKDEGPNKELMLTMKNMLEEEFYNVEIKLLEVDQPFDELDRLGSGELDFLLYENYSPFNTHGVATAFLTYPKFLHVFYRSANTPVNDFGELIRNRKIYLEHPSSAERLVLKDLANFYGINRDSYELTEDFFECDVIMDLSSFLSEEFINRIAGFELFSFGDVNNFGRGSEADGISLTLHRLQPYIIPRGTYGDLTPVPKVTLELDMLMLASQHTGNIAVFDLISAVLRHKQTFVSIDPILFIGLDEEFDRSRLSYPLHEGSRAYLDRENPSFFERYAEVISVTFSILVVLITGMVRYSKSRMQRKKDRVDVFYKELMDIKNENINTVEIANQKISQVKKSQNKAFDLLINEELSANESFRIYMELSKETIAELRMKRKKLQASLYSTHTDQT